jgi:hypothetical protein
MSRRRRHCVRTSLGTNIKMLGIQTATAPLAKSMDFLVNRQRRGLGKGRVRRKSGVHRPDFVSFGARTSVHCQGNSCDPLCFWRCEKQHAMGYILGSSQSWPRGVLQSALMPLFPFRGSRSSQRGRDKTRTNGVDIDSLRSIHDC